MMGNSLSWFSSGKKPSEHDLHMVLYRRYLHKSEIFDTIKLNENQVLAAGSQLGTIHLYNLAAEDQAPQQTRYLEYSFGGVSDMVWINDEILAVGTTRGNVVVFSIGNEHNRLIEVCCVKAHGDGAALIAVASMDYCKTSHLLATVGEGVGSLRIWKVSSIGKLDPVELSAISTAYIIPDFVSFTNKGSNVLVGFSQTARIDRFSLDPFKILDSSVLEEDSDHRLDQNMCGALWLESTNQLAVLNPAGGLRLYDASSFKRRYALAVIIEEDCHQQFASMKGGSFLAVAGAKGLVQILHSRDASIALKLKVPNSRKPFINAIHASSSKDGHELLAVASNNSELPTTLTIWCNRVNRHDHKKGASEFSTFRMIVLCALVSFLCHFLASTVMRLDRQIVSNFSPIGNASSLSSSPKLVDSDVESLGEPTTTLVISPSELVQDALPSPSIIFL